MLDFIEEFARSENRNTVKCRGEEQESWKLACPSRPLPTPRRVSNGIT